MTTTMDDFWAARDLAMAARDWQRSVETFLALGRDGVISMELAAKSAGEQQMRADTAMRVAMRLDPSLDAAAYYEAVDGE